MSGNPTIVFVCEHGAAKSIIAATYFNKLAQERNIHIRAIARGTHPDAELSRYTVMGLQKDDLSATESAPQQLTLADVEFAKRIIAFCELPEEYQSETPLEQWNDIPAVSENYEAARDAIIKHLNQLLDP